MHIINNFKRKENKYIININDIDNLISSLGELISVTDSGITNTLYFDTDVYKFFVDGIVSKDKKFKVRLRKYDSADKVYMEYKIKDEDGMSLKHRILMTDDNSINILVNRTISSDELGYIYKLNSDIPNDEVKLLIFNIMVMKLHPTLQTSYIRTSYENMDLNNLRITIDTDILYEPKNSFMWNFDRSEMKVFDLLNDKSIVEIKYENNLSIRVKNILLNLDMNPVKFSKYINMLLDDMLINYIKIK
ncbi:MAG: VTC domain-containing protein [Pelagibacterales bacterium]|nr:VTC domain-containing protein [Pelagibacterales bacterium]